MSVVFEGAPSEKASPFFKQNEKICKLWEEYILKRGGSVKGKYNSWSLIVRGHLEDNWEVEVKKSTFSNGNLLLSSEFQNLFFHVELINDGFLSESKDFVIRKRKIFDRWRKVLPLGMNAVYISGMYFISSDERNNVLLEDIKSLFSKNMQLGRLKSVVLKGQKLTITMDSEIQDFELIDNLLNY